jgi:rhodanese-related sulfurtransferase
MKLQRMVLLCLLAVVMGAGGSVLPVWAKDKFEKEVDKEAAAVKLVREVQRGGYNVVTTAGLKEWIDAGKDMVIVDTMPLEASYEKNHVPGAVQFLFPIADMPSWDTKETDGRAPADYASLLGSDKGKTIVVYCGFVKCTRSHNGAAWAVKLGYTNVYRHPGGIFAWKGAGFPVATGKP